MDIVIVGGPTSSGKSALSIALAKKLDAEIIILDAVQIYKGLVIGSGAVTEEEAQGVPHHLIGVWEPTAVVEASRIVTAIDEAIADIHSRNKIPIITAGNTMYLTMLLHGYSEAPEANTPLRELWKSVETYKLYQSLVEKDPAVAETLSPNDRPRIERALEVIESTGKSIATFRDAHKFKDKKYNAILFSLWCDRSVLYERINTRCAQMLSNGIVAEYQNIAKRYGSEAQALRSIGYSLIPQLLSGELSEDAFIEKFSQDTRNYAKRQMTFWKNDPQKRGWSVSPTGPGESVSYIGNDTKIKSKGPAPRGMWAYNWTFEAVLDKLKGFVKEPSSGIHLFNLNGDTAQKQ